MDPTALHQPGWGRACALLIGISLLTPPPYQEDPEQAPFQSPGPKTQLVRHPSPHLPNIWTCSGEPLISGNFFPHLICLFKENKLLLIRSAVEMLSTSELPTFRRSA